MTTETSISGSVRESRVESGPAIAVPAKDAGRAQWQSHGPDRGRPQWRRASVGSAADVRRSPLRPDLRADRARAVLGAALALLGGADEDGDLAQVLVLVHELV